MDCCFNPLNTRGVYISSSEMLLSNQGRMMSCATLSGQPANLKDIKDIHATPLSCLKNNH